MGTGVATFGPGVTSGIPITGGGSSPGYTTGAAGGFQNTAPTSNQYNGGNFATASAPVIQNTPPPAPPPDPFAQWGGQTNYNNLTSGFNTQDQNIFNSSNDAANGAARTRGDSITDFLHSLETGQGALNDRGTNNELNKMQGASSITDMVGRGLKSGGVLLSNRNALSSSAAQAIANAYADMGNREMNKVNNGYALENNAIGKAQTEFDWQKGNNLHKFDTSKQDSVDSIVNSARDSLAQLDAAMVNADMPTRFAIQQQQDQIRATVNGVLGRDDARLSTGAGAVHATNADERRATAASEATAGVAGTNPFDFSTQVPTQFQGTGPFGSGTDFPLFSVRGSKQTAA